MSVLTTLRAGCQRGEMPSRTVEMLLNHERSRTAELLLGRGRSRTVEKLLKREKDDA